jgi:hypothetical protein
MGSALVSFVIFIIILILSAIGIVGPFWFNALAAIYIVIGFALTVLLAGTGAENMKTGVIMLILGTIMFLISFFVIPIFSG